VALAGLLAIVGIAVAVLAAAGVLGNQGGGEGIESVELPATPEDPSGAVTDVGAEKGKLALDFVISDYDGVRHRLSDYRGQVVYVNFWATWCVPCQAELPDLAQLQADNPSDLVVITVNRREPLDRAESYFEKIPNLQGGEGISFPVNGIDPDDTLFDAYRGLGMPTSVIVDPNGVVSSRADGLLTLEEMQAAVDEASG
jgi:cytochrome c-type biogenesis protein